MSLSSAVLNQLKSSTLLPSANVALQNKKYKVWETDDIHVPISKYKPMNQNNNDIDDNKSSSNNTNAFQTIKIVHISDTHQKHARMEALIPNGDILIHSGDFVSKCDWNTINDKKTANINNIPLEILEFNEWIKKLPHKYKIVIAGNHEKCFNELTPNIIRNKLLTNCIYLQDNFIEIYGLKIYGTPWTPSHQSWGFGTNGYNNYLYSKWNQIPSNCDILITHQPPYGYFDLAYQNTNGLLPPCDVIDCNKKRHNNSVHWGCRNLLYQVQNRIQPYIHLFGHVHDSVGYKYDNDILFVNSSMDIMNKPHRIKVIFDLK